LEASAGPLPLLRLACFSTRHNIAQGKSGHTRCTACRQGEWMDVEVPLERFLLTWRGKLVETRVEMNPKRILSLGISLAGGAELQPEGPFRLGLRAILAQNSRVIMSDQDLRQ
jgi:hypothetical protein